MSKEKEKKIVVSDLFKEIYLNFNVSVQIENMKNLNKRELYLFLTYALDKHSDEDPVVLHNFQPFKDEVMEIYDIQDDKEATNDILLALIEETGDKYIETDDLVDSEGNKLREPLSKTEVRDAKIDITMGKYKLEVYRSNKTESLIAVPYTSTEAERKEKLEDDAIFIKTIEGEDFDDCIVKFDEYIDTEWGDDDEILNIDIDLL